MRLGVSIELKTLYRIVFEFQHKSIKFAMKKKEVAIDRLPSLKRGMLLEL